MLSLETTGTSCWCKHETSRTTGLLLRLVPASSGLEGCELAKAARAEDDAAVEAGDGCVLIWFIEVLVAQNTATIPVNVGVVLDLEFSGGNIGLTCINMALSDFYATHSDYKTRLVLTTRNSGNDVVGAAAAGSL
ncbi:hypothetical protein NC651_037968 [Populus alba x Populus x berolinensis]|nr:hypothetical protein NC651_037839 [Populus alba x Populus x berolinensis]KAJ6856092.1 hypothetical protein NC651_037840 [Populus alba x Populus x berolinensis]KAJ6856237.1 hypothetical protein NC651_037968 [Populus alba x Populus x berolinensis]